MLVWGSLRKTLSSKEIEFQNKVLWVCKVGAAAGYKTNIRLTFCLNQKSIWKQNWTSKQNDKRPKKEIKLILGLNKI